MKKRNKKEIEFIEWLKYQIEESDEDFDFFRPLSKTEMPSPETFMIGPSGFVLRRRRRIIIGVVSILVAVVLLSGVYLRGKQERSFSEGPVAQAFRYGQTSLINEGNGFVEIGSENKNIGKTIVYEKEADIEIAQKNYPNLLVPEYIPKGYYFENLTIEIKMNGFWCYRFTYKNKTEDKTLKISQEGIE